MKTLIFIIVLFLITTELILSQCPVPGSCTNPYTYMKCQGLVPICYTNPANISDLYRAPLNKNMCFQFVNNGLPIVQMPIQTGAYNIYYKTDMPSEITRSVNSWYCLCLRQQEPCDIRIQVGFIDNVNDLNGGNPKTVLAQMQFVRSNCQLVNTGSFDKGSSRIVINNTKDFTDANPNEPLKKKYYATQTFFNDPFYEDFKKQMVAGTKFFDLEAILAHEVGHAFGLDHHNDPTATCHTSNSGVMNSSVAGNREIFLTDSDKCQYMKMYCENRIGTSVEQEIVANVSFEILPNPSSNEVKVRILGEKGASSIAYISIVDILGKEVKSLNFENTNEINVSVRDLLPGLYYVRCLSEGSYNEKKLVVSR